MLNPESLSCESCLEVLTRLVCMHVGLEMMSGGSRVESVSLNCFIHDSL